jgi:hypothetical protein
VAKAERTGEPLRVCLICAPQRTRPVPDKLICCGLSVLLSLIETLALRGPVVVGLKITLMLQVLPAATLVPHGFVGLREKSPGLVPVMVMLLMVSAELPVLVRIVVWAVLLWPMTPKPKSRSSGTSFTLPEETVIVTRSDLAESDVEVAVSVTLGLDGTLAGAV